MAATVVNCNLCKQKIGNNTLALQCSGPCRGKFHLTCTTVSKLDYKEVKTKGNFRCKTCLNLEGNNQEKDNNMAYNDEFNIPSLDGSDGTMFNLKMTMEQKIDQMLKEFTDLKNFCEFVSKKLDDYEKDRKKIHNLEEKVQKLEKENTYIKQTMDTLTLKIAEKEQTELANTCVIYGTTKDKKEEDTPNLVCQIATKLNCKISQEDIETCSRMNHQEPNKPTAIVVKFKSPVIQQSLIKASKTAFKAGNSVTTKHVNLPGQERPIFVNPYMTVDMRYMYNQARRLRRECGYKYVWFANNKVYVKKYEEDRPQVIKSPYHVSQLLLNTPKTPAFIDEAINSMK